MRIAFLAATAVLPVFLIQIPTQTAGGNAARGSYLVEDVAMCVQCHSPRDEHGNLLRDRLFMGAPVPVERPRFLQDWAISAPRLAGLPGYAEEDALRLWMRGIARTGNPPRPPMPPFRLTEQDARDIYAFLKSRQ